MDQQDHISTLERASLPACSRVYKFTPLACCCSNRCKNDGTALEYLSIEHYQPSSISADTHLAMGQRAESTSACRTLVLLALCCCAPLAARADKLQYFGVWDLERNSTPANVSSWANFLFTNDDPAIAARFYAEGGIKRCVRRRAWASSEHPSASGLCRAALAVTLPVVSSNASCRAAALRAAAHRQSPARGVHLLVRHCAVRGLPASLGHSAEHDGQQPHASTVAASAAAATAAATAASHAARLLLCTMA